MGLTAAQIAIVKSTVPILKAHGNTITTTFYRSLLSEHPELKNIFSLRTQSTGAQQSALASSVLAYAQHIDNLEALLPAVEHIAQKHTSLSVAPEHYPIVGKYLVGAFQEVLGDALTPDVKNAWIAAYEQLAGIFVNREEQIYRELGSWTSWRKFYITKKEPVCDGIFSFYLKPVDGRPLPPFSAGQYVSVRVPIDQLNGLLQSRQFSISIGPSESMEYYRITVKREADQPLNISLRDDATGKVAGLVSNLLQDKYTVGNQVEVSPPRGEFTFDPTTSPASTPVVLLSAGVGATPLLSILDAILDSEYHDRRVYWIHGARNSAAVCYGDVIKAVTSQHLSIVRKLFLSQPRMGDVQGTNYDYKGRVNLPTLLEASVLPINDKTTEYFICGPEPWMVSLRSALLSTGVGLDRIHIELFGTGTV